MPLDRPDLPDDINSFDDSDVWDNVGEALYAFARKARVIRPDPDPRLRGGASLSSWQSVPLPATNQVDFVVRGKSRALTSRERAASGGVYTSEDLAWLLPRKHLPQDFLAQEGDAVVEKDGTRWTVLEASWQRFRQTWKLTTRCLKIAYRLRDEIDVERARISYDAAGVPVKHFPPAGGQILFSRVAARVQPQSRDRVLEHGQLTLHERVTIHVEKELELCSEDRIRWGGVYLDVLSYTMAERIDELPQIEAVRKG